ncbi:MAG: family 1 glycosylhydrolase [Spirochaetales bacterium]|nr:family 1 glycosylhydrolase [Spirochaetales bacterium]
MKEKNLAYEVPEQSLIKNPHFSDSVMFGASSSAYQIEGSVGIDGRGLSSWDVFSHKRKKIANSDNGDVAADHYNLYKDDIVLMNRMSLDSYKFSISWPRIFSKGFGSVNQSGLDFYDRLVDELLNAEIRPFVSLFHWDFPYTLAKKKCGFDKRQAAYYFADYADVVVNKLGDRVKDWFTFEQPFLYSTMGYLLGQYPPSKKNPLLWIRCVHNQLLAHGLAMERIKAYDKVMRVGMNINYWPIKPATKASVDLGAVDLADQFLNRVFLEPLFKGKYPEKVLSRMSLIWSKFPEGDLDIISKPVSFLGININTGVSAGFAPWIPFLGLKIKRNRIPSSEYIKNGKRYNALGHEVNSESVYNAMTCINRDYGNIPLYVSVSGANFTDNFVENRIPDEARLHYLSMYLEQAAHAAEEGCELRGCFIDPFLDGFEWRNGYSKRSGLVYVDFETQKRTIKDSGYWYRDIIRMNRAD